MQPFISTRREAITELCRKHHVRRLTVFGSAVRDDFDPERSDIDLRVEFDALAAVAYANNYFALRDAFIGLFGREVDLLSSPTIRNPHFKKALEESQVLLYAA
jgi:predicted nucleotidyltransferase